VTALTRSFPGLEPGHSRDEATLKAQRYRGIQPALRPRDLNLIRQSPSFGRRSPLRKSICSTDATEPDHSGVAPSV
jgi:hypothetical protein